MKRLSPVLAQAVEDSDWGAEYTGAYFHWCPACEGLHPFFVDKPWVNGARWSFDGNVASPTFAPSMNIVGRCHYHIRSGRIEFCGDSTHKLSGQTVPLPPIPEDML